MLCLPESPRWYAKKIDPHDPVLTYFPRLISKDRIDEGTAVIAALLDEPIDSELVRIEQRVILESMAADNIGAKTSYRDLFTSGKTQNFRRMMLGASSQIMQQIGGCNAVI